MAERQQPPPGCKCTSLDKIIESMIADLENPAAQHVQFGVTPLQTTPHGWGDYPTGQPRHYVTSQPPLSPQPGIQPINPISSPIDLQEISPPHDPPLPGPIYFPPQSPNYLAINENKDLVGVIDVGDGNYINVYYGNALQIIDNLLGNLVSNQSGTYSPFGGSANVTPVLQSTPEIRETEELPRSPRNGQHKKPRMVAAVRPMTPSHPDVWRNSAPTPPPLGSQTDTSDKKSHLWSDSETRLMLDKYKLYLPQIGAMNKFKSKKVMWAQIAKDMDNMFNIKTTALQVENRYKTVLKRKKKAVENNSKSGSARENVPFEDELGKIANADDSIEPEVLRSAKTVKYLKRPLEQISTNSCSNDDTSGNSKKQRKLTACEQLIELSKQEEEANERRHQEKLALMRELLSSQKNPDT